MILSVFFYINLLFHYQRVIELTLIKLGLIRNIVIDILSIAHGSNRGNHLNSLETSGIALYQINWSVKRWVALWSFNKNMTVYLTSFYHIHEITDLEFGSKKVQYPIFKMTKHWSFLTMSNRLNRFGYCWLWLTFERRWRRDRSFDSSRPTALELQENVKIIKFNPIKDTSLAIVLLSTTIVHVSMCYYTIHSKSPIAIC